MSYTGKVIGNYYLAKNEMDLSSKSGNTVTGQMIFRLDQKVGQEYFKTAEDKYIVGIYAYSLKYPDDDHHVKRIALKIKPEIKYGSDNVQEIQVNISGEMSDLSNHSSNTLHIGLSLVAISSSVQMSEKDGKVLDSGEGTVSLVALQEFSVEFQDDDHHVKEYSAEIAANGTQGTAEIADDSKHVGNGIAIGKKIQSPAALLGYMISEDVQFINKFKLAKDSGDHHVFSTGINYIQGQANFDLSDDSGNYASIGSCYCYVNTYGGNK